MIFLHEIIIKKLVATHVFFELLIISFYDITTALSLFYYYLYSYLNLRSDIMYCSVFILFLLVVFSLSLNFWNSSQPILFGGMLMPKFAALSNHTTWKCQRRKGKRCRIPKVKITRHHYEPKICNYYKNQQIRIFYSTHLGFLFNILLYVQSLQNKTSKLSEKSCTKKLLHDQKKEKTMKNETFFYSGIA